MNFQKLEELEALNTQAETLRETFWKYASHTSRQYLDYFKTHAYLRFKVNKLELEIETEVNELALTYFKDYFDNGPKVMRVLVSPRAQMGPTFEFDLTGTVPVVELTEYPIFNYTLSGFDRTEADVMAVRAAAFRLARKVATYRG